MFNHLTSYMKSQFFCLLFKHILLTKFVLRVTKKLIERALFEIT